MNAPHHQTEPQAIQLAGSIISSVAENGIAAAHGMTPEEFPTPDLAGLFAAVADARHQLEGKGGTRVDHGDIALHWLTTRPEDAADLARQLQDARESPTANTRAATLAAVEFLLSHHRSRLLWQNDQAINAAVQSGKPLDDLLAERQELRKGGTRDGIAEALAARRFDSGTIPPRPVPILKLGESVISTPGNLTNIQAPAKAGKSAALSGMLAAMFTRSPEADTLGFHADNLEGKAVIHFDTEQSRFDHDQLVRRALRRAKVTAPPPWFYSYSVADLGHLDRLQAWEAAIDSAARECGGIHAVFLDGVADICIDPNDSAEAFGLVASLHSTAIRHDCGIITVLHENPGSENGKTRGHLGSQIERKAETNLRLAKDANGITTIWADRARHGHIPKDSGTCFEWSDAAAMHVSCGTAREIKSAAKREKLQAEADKAFDGADSLSYTELARAIVERLEVGDRTAKDRIKVWLAEGITRKNANGNHTLANP